ncbi:VOC family protein [Paenibacillus sp. PR3]|uniref:VOC family protein n=1 Tax=Paenibacillus terricola TaxID=2763503 RepID=A0ABR8N1W7_9BACL|nr:VOC family protein [Paenibacillus terricola]MBD3920464.1 VOC family protein [Paenibacillus terricola]
MEQTEVKQLVHAIVQVRVPVRDIDESVAWYEKHFGFVHAWKIEDESDLKLEPGAFLFLKRVGPQQLPLRIESQGKPYAMLCLKTSNITECHRKLAEVGETVTEITNTWGIDRLLEFDVIDPSGNVINVANYPDLPMEGF